MEALHRQALPFLLRRMKEDVLQDLPPKITQDYYCELSSLQEQLYEDFARSHAHQSLQETLAHGGQAGTIQGSTHIFQVIKQSANWRLPSILQDILQNWIYSQCLADEDQRGCCTIASYS
jgi:TATA-binding protein-associated factor